MIALKFLIANICNVIDQYEKQYKEKHRGVPS